MRFRPLVRATSVLFVGAAVSCTEPNIPKAAAVAAVNVGEQSATVGTSVAQPPAVKVTDAGGAPFMGAVVTFTVASGGGSIAIATDTSNDVGIASAGQWTLGTAAGTNTVTATVATLESSPVTFTATGTAGAATQVATHAGNGQAGTAGLALPTPPAVIVKDVFNNPVSGVAVTFAVTSGNGSISGGSATTDATGVAAVNWVLGTAVGLNTMSATVSGMPTVSFSATAQAGPAATLSIQRQPSRSSSGAVIGKQPIVRLLDANGNLSTSTAQVTAVVASGSGTLSGTTAVAAVGGVATFTNLAITGTGTTAITFTAPGVTSATSASFTVVAPAGAATKLGMLTQVGTAVSGSVFATQPEVEIQDAVGTLVTAASAAVTATIASGPGTLSGTTTVNTVNGIASFTDLRINGSGTSTITFTATGLTSVTSASITVSGPQVLVLELVEGDRQAVMAGGAVSTKPSVRALGANFQPVAGARVTFAVTSGGGSVTTASAVTNASGIATVGGWTLGTEAALNTLSATVEGTSVSGNPVTFSGSACTGGGTGFRITLCFTSEMSATQKVAFSDAAAKWESIITSEPQDANFTGGVNAGVCGANGFALAPGTIVDDLLIFAAVVPIDGPGAVLGSAGPCFLRQATAGTFAVGDFSVVGQMRFDAADMASMESNPGRLPAVILHEMGHVLGIGSLWGTFGQVQLPSTATSQNDTHYLGHNAIEGFNAIGFAGYSGNKVPVENTGGAGTINSHWRESVLINELMTGFINNGPNPLTLLSVRSLQDLGYTVNLAAADSYNSMALERAIANGRRVPPLQLLNDVDFGPLYGIDSRGRIRRIR